LPLHVISAGQAGHPEILSGYIAGQMYDPRYVSYVD